MTAHDVLVHASKQAKGDWDLERAINIVHENGFVVCRKEPRAWAKGNAVLRVDDLEGTDTTGWTPLYAEAKEGQ